jgi:hypothetical protein
VAGEGRVATNLSSRLLAATAAVLSCLALLWVYTSIESFAASKAQNVSKLILPVWATDGDATSAEPSEDDDTPTPTLVPADSSSSLEGTDMDFDPSTSERIEAAYKDPSAHQESKKPADNATRRDSSLDSPLNSSASRPGTYTVLPEVEFTSTSSPLSGNIVTFSQENPFQGSTDLGNGVPAQPVPVQDSSSNTPEVTETSPQLQPDLPVGTETSTQAPQDLPTEVVTPSQASTSPETTTPTGSPPNPTLGDQRSPGKQNR